VLVLSRKVGEGVWVGEYRIVVVDVSRGKVRLGIIAPEDVLIARDEVREKMLARRRADAGPGREGGA
jgi:carbon storage regulator CsrA